MPYEGADHAGAVLGRARIDPRGDLLSELRAVVIRPQQPLLRTVWVGMLVLLPLIEIFNAAPAFGWSMPNSIRLISVGLLLMVIGNALPKSRPGFFVGIRTPWTITDTDNWIATNRLGGKLMMLGGLVIALSALVPLEGRFRVVLFFATIAAMVLPPLAYSWWFWHRKNTHA